MSVPQIILQQLFQGPVRGALIGMTNILHHNIEGEPEGVSFRFRGSRKANYCKITLLPSDTYRFELKRIGRAPKYIIKDVVDLEGVYNDQLKECFEEHTGLYLKLF